MHAWHSDREMKKHAIASLRADRDAGALIQDVYLDTPPYADGTEEGTDPHYPRGHKGCAIGCLVTSRYAYPYFLGDWHADGERLFRIPQEILHLIDKVYENLPGPDHDSSEHARFAVDVFDAIPVGADLSAVGRQLILVLLVDVERGVVERLGPLGDTLTALYTRAVSGDGVSPEEWLRVRDDAHRPLTMNEDFFAYSAAHYPNTDSVTSLAVAVADAVRIMTRDMSFQDELRTWIWVAERLVTILSMCE